MNKLDFRIIDDVIKHEKKIGRMTIYEFAEISHVSEGKITKFCQKLGLDGFKQLKTVLQSKEQIKTNNMVIMFFELKGIGIDLESVNQTSISYEWCMNYYGIFYDMYCEVVEAPISGLSIQMEKKLSYILNYYTNLVKNQDQNYYNDFFILIQHEINSMFKCY